MLLQLTHSKDEIAIHEAAHSAVAYSVGLAPKVVYLTEEVQGRFTGKADSAALDNGGFQVAVSCVAGLLAQAKFVAIRDCAEEVKFRTQREWESVAAYFTGESRAVIPELAFETRNGHIVRVSCEFAIHLLVDSQKARANLLGNTRDPASKALVPVFCECAARLDDVDVWAGIKSLAEALLSAPVSYRLLEESQILGCLKKIVPQSPSPF